MADAPPAHPFAVARRELTARGSAVVAVRALPGAPRTEAVETLADGSIKIRIAAPPEGGKANAELIRFIAKTFGLPRAKVMLIAGAADRRKLVRIVS